MSNDRNDENSLRIKPVQLRYPLEDWIEELLQNYPEELATIRPDRYRRRARRRNKTRRSLQQPSSRKLF